MIFGHEVDVSAPYMITICWCALVTGQQIQVTECRHKYHLNCLQHTLMLEER